MRNQGRRRRFIAVVITLARTTSWFPDGTVELQMDWKRDESGRSHPIHIAEPPWLWNVTNQTEPTDPQWIAEHGKQ